MPSKAPSLEKQYSKAFSSSGAWVDVFPAAAKLEMANMVEAIAQADVNVASRLETNQSPCIKGGYIAEEWHGLTFNLDAILKNSKLQAFTDRHEGVFQQLGLKGNDGGVDLAVVKNGSIQRTAQSKYCDRAESTNYQMSQLKDGRPKYEGVDDLVGPSDQINPTDGSVSIKEQAQAAAEGHAARGGDPAQVNAFEQTSRKATDRIEADGVASTPLSKQESEAMGRGDLSRKYELQRSYQNSSTVKHMGSAAMNAAALSAVLCGAVNTIKYLQLVHQGQMQANEAVVKIFAEVTSAAADSAIKAAANTGIQSTLVRFGTRQAAQSVLSSSVKVALKTNVVTVGVVCAVDCIKDLVKLSAGKITSDQLKERQAKNVISTGAGVAGCALGKGAMMALGAGGFLPLAGALAGGIIATMALQFAIEEHIDKPFRELVENTTALEAAIQELERVSLGMYAGQVVFGKYLEETYLLDLAHQDMDRRLALAGAEMRNAIDSI